MSKVSLPGVKTESASAIEPRGGTEMRLPCRFDSAIEGLALGCTPITRHDGRKAFTAEAMPATKPPPLIGTTTQKSLSSASSSSSPIVPSPPIVSSES
jgi:hypothetical protein